MPPRLDVRESPGRGMGLFAIDAIPAYGRIVEDFALLTLAHDEDALALWDKYQALPAEDRESFFDALTAPDYHIRKEADTINSLRDRGHDRTRLASAACVLSRFKSNAFLTDMPRWSMALFATVARINHSCTPNAHIHERDATRASYLYALRDIAAGEEIEIAYFDVKLPLAHRRAQTSVWSFTCRCRACSGRLGREYEAQLAFVRGWSQSDGGEEAKFRSRSVQALEHTQRAIGIATADAYPWLRASLPALYKWNANALMSAGQSAASLAEALEQSARWLKRIKGADHPDLGVEEKMAEAIRGETETEGDDLFVQNMRLLRDLAGMSRVKVFMC